MVPDLARRLNALSREKQDILAHELFAQASLAIEINGLWRDAASRSSVTPMADKTKSMSVRVSMSPAPPEGSQIKVRVTAHSAVTGEELTSETLKGLSAFTQDVYGKLPKVLVLTIAATGRSEWEYFHFGFTGKLTTFNYPKTTFFLRAETVDCLHPTKVDTENFIVNARRMDSNAARLSNPRCAPVGATIASTVKRKGAPQEAPRAVVVAMRLPAPASHAVAAHRDHGEENMIARVPFVAQAL